MSMKVAVNGIKSKTAFTLIELLVVIAIISLLVAILLPSLNKAKELARRVVCSGNTRALAMTTLVYTEDNNGTLPTPYSWSGKICSSYYFEKLNWDYSFGLLVGQDYIDSGNIFFCPSDTLFEPIYKDKWETNNDIRSSYSYRFNSETSDEFSFRLGDANKAQVPIISDIFTTNSSNWVASHNPSGTYSSSYTSPPFPVGFNVAHIDGCVIWLPYSNDLRPAEYNFYKDNFD